MSKETESGAAKTEKESNAAKTKGMHDGHRERMRDRVLKDSRNSFEGFQDHELLEMLLYFVNSRKNTNPIAHSLINEFGSLGLVMNAPFARLKKVDGCGQQSALLIKLCREISVRCQREDVERSTRKFIADSDDAIEYFRPRYIGKEHEVVMVAFLDNKGSVINTVEFPPGQVNNSGVDIREIVQRAINVNAALLVMAHNHPRGSARPSSEDFSVTDRLRDVLRPMRMILVDHIVFGENDDVYSMVKSGQLPKFRIRRPKKHEE